MLYCDHSECLVRVVPGHPCPGSISDYSCSPASSIYVLILLSIRQAQVFYLNYVSKPEQTLEHQYYVKIILIKMTGPKRPHSPEETDSRKRHRSVSTDQDTLPSTSSQHQGSCQDRDDSHHVTLDTFPWLILHMIVDSLGVGDVRSLRCVNKTFKHYIDSHYQLLVSLSGTPPNTPTPSSSSSSSSASVTPSTSSLLLSSLSQSSVRNLWVLSLSISYNLSQLPGGKIQSLI